MIRNNKNNYDKWIRFATLMAGKAIICYFPNRKLSIQFFFLFHRIIIDY